MIMGSIGNVFGAGVTRKCLCHRRRAQADSTADCMEQFSAGLGRS
jgi:hypothetical protein